MPDPSPHTAIPRFLFLLLPLLGVGLTLVLTGGWSWHLFLLVILLIATAGALVIYRYESDLAEVRKDLNRQLQTVAHDLNSAHFLTSIVEGISDPLILLDAKRQVVEANRAARALLGAMIVGKDIAFHLRHPAALEAIEKAIRDGIASEQEITLTSPLERDYLMRVNLCEAPPVTGGSGLQTFIIISIYDISKIKLTEKMRVDFVANASHELRTPLASVLGFIETLQSIGDKDKEKRQKFLKIMEAEAARMARLIDDLLSLSRIEMDQNIAPDQPVDIAGVLKSVTRALNLKLEEKNSSIVFDIEKNLPEILGDRDQLVQVFTNLFDNALKYGRAGEPIRVKARSCEKLQNRDPGPGVAISVFNSGDGIPAEHIPRLTERFYRVDAARSRQLGGTGLGLAIVKHIITRHRGFLKIESILGHGTTVTVELPRKNPDEAGSGLS
jgi:two-component system phosphate regulon sensor histidine kinase PhoR